MVYVSYTDLSIMFLGCCFFLNYTIKKGVFWYVFLSLLVLWFGILDFCLHRVTPKALISPSCLGLRGCSPPNTRHTSVPVGLLLISTVIHSRLFTWYSRSLTISPLSASPTLSYISSLYRFIANVRLLIARGVMDLSSLEWILQDPAVEKCPWNYTLPKCLLS